MFRSIHDFFETCISIGKYTEEAFTRCDVIIEWCNHITQNVNILRCRLWKLQWYKRKISSKILSYIRIRKQRPTHKLSLWLSHYHYYTQRQSPLHSVYDCQTIITTHKDSPPPTPTFSLWLSNHHYYTQIWRQRLVIPQVILLK